MSGASNILPFLITTGRLNKIYCLIDIIKFKENIMMGNLFFIRSLIAAAAIVLFSTGAEAASVLDMPLDEGPDKPIINKANPGKNIGKGIKWISEKGRNFAFFEGANSYISLESQGVMPQVFSLSFWICPERNDDIGKSGQIYVSEGAAGSGYNGGFSVFGQQEAGQYRLQLTISNASKFKSFRFPLIPMNAFSFASCTMDGKTVKLFLNGKEVLSEAYSQGIRYAEKKSLSCIGNVGPHPFFGIIANFKLDSDVHSQADFQRQYESDIVLRDFKMTQAKNSDPTYIPSDRLHIPDSYCL